jgi:hypothetical protein
MLWIFSAEKNPTASVGSEPAIELKNIYSVGNAFIASLTVDVV